MRLIGKLILHLIPTRLFWPGVVLVALLLLWGAFHYPTIHSLLKAREQRDRYRESVAELEREKATLLTERPSLQAGGFASEKAVRERFLMVKPGEHILLVQGEAPSHRGIPGAGLMPLGKNRPALPSIDPLTAAEADRPHR